MAQQSPHQIRGTVTLGGSAKQGATIWAMDITEGTFRYRKKDVSLVYTDSDGHYIIELANITSAWADGDRIRVYCKVGEIETYTDVYVSIQAGFSVADFTIVRKSGLVDGARDTVSTTGENGLFGIGTGKKYGVKDALQ